MLDNDNHRPLKLPSGLLAVALGVPKRPPPLVPAVMANRRQPPVIVTTAQITSPLTLSPTPIDHAMALRLPSCIAGPAQMSPRLPSGGLTGPWRDP